MAADWAQALEALPLARALRDSVWVYPLVNAGHILGVALLVGAILPLDLRLLGGWRTLPLAPLWRALGATAAVGLLMAAALGALLFTARASEYVASPFFQAKMAVVAAGIVNAIALRVAMRGRLTSATTAERSSAEEHLPARVRVAALLSLIAWLAALTLGRLVGYF